MHRIKDSWVESNQSKTVISTKLSEVSKAAIISVISTLIITLTTEALDASKSMVLTKLFGWL